MDLILLGLGLVLVFEGLVLALLPQRLEELIRMLENIPLETRRMMGLAAVGIGVFLVYLVRGF